MDLRYLHGGESHGPANTAIIEGFWSNVEIDCQVINKELARRQLGYGRGKRMKIERDEVEILSGVRLGVTLGSPVTLKIANRDHANWAQEMSPCPLQNEPDERDMRLRKRVTRPRPGHADLPGALKYRHQDIRNVLERSSARETAIRTAVGAFCRNLLALLDISVNSYVVRIGEAVHKEKQVLFSRETLRGNQLAAWADESSVRALDMQTTEEMVQEIDRAWQQGDTLGGQFEVIVDNIPPGIGTYVCPDRKLDGRLAAALMSLQGIKGVEVGAGMRSALFKGSEMHDEIYHQRGRGFYRNQNNAGGIEGGISNGEPIVMQAAMKPIPTLSKPLNSVDIESGEPFKAQVERSDACAVPAASIIAENIAAFEITRALKEKFGGDCWEELRDSYSAYLHYLNKHHGYGYNL